MNDQNKPVNTVVAKMQVWGKAPNEHSKEGMVNISMGAVYRDIKQFPDDENAIFGSMTPNARLDIGIVNPPAIDFFEPGVEYYVEFKRVPGSLSFKEQEALHIANGGKAWPKVQGS